MPKIVYVIGPMTGDEPLVWHKPRDIWATECGLLSTRYFDRPQDWKNEVNLAHIPNAIPCEECHA